MFKDVKSPNVTGNL